MVNPIKSPKQYGNGSHQSNESTYSKLNFIHGINRTHEVTAQKKQQKKTVSIEICIIRFFKANDEMGNTSNIGLANKYNSYALSLSLSLSLSLTLSLSHPSYQMIIN